MAKSNLARGIFKQRATFEKVLTQQEFDPNRNDAERIKQELIIF